MARIGTPLRVVITALLIVTSAACFTGPTETPETPAAGTLSVEVGYGAGGAGGGFCADSATVAIHPQGLTGTQGSESPDSRVAPYNRIATSENPACKATATFGGLRTGRWIATYNGISCAATVSGGAWTTVRIIHNTCR